MAQVIPNNIDEALAAWDAGEEVQTVEMGGMGAGYEMAIQTVAFELMRALRDDPVLAQINAKTGDSDKFPPEFGRMLDERIWALDAKDPETGRPALGGLSGAQAGAAKNIAINLTRHGYESARRQCADRLIFVRKQDPTALYDAESPATSTHRMGD